MGIFFRISLNKDVSRITQQTEQSKTVSSLSRLWKDGKVPFTYRGNLAARWMGVRRAIIERAMRDIQENSCVVFEDITELLKQNISKPDDDHL